jgi:hypothetical protein
MRKMRMKNFRFSQWFVILAFAASLAGCSEDGEEGGSPQATLETGLFGTIEGASGALSGVTVEVNGVSATTDSSGEYVIQTGTGPAVVSFKADGYLPTVRKVTIADGSPTAAHLTLQPRATATPVDADAGGMVSGARSSSVMIEPGALSGPGGTSVTGMVDVYLTPVDPSDSDEVQALTGSFEGQSTAGTSLLESFGMVDVTITQGDDELQVAPGETLEIRIPAPAGAVPSELPATMPLWSLDEDSGQWVEEGTATLDEVTNTYVGEISHMSAWNADKQTEATCITGLAVDSNGDPIAGAEIDAKGLDYFGSSSGSTGADGRFYIPVRKSSEVSVAVSHDNEGGQIRNVTSGGEDTTVPPTAGDSRCTDVGTFTIQRGVVLLADGSVVTCDNAQAAGVFAGTCAEGFGDIFLCWNPQGSCTVGTTGVMYQNGARVDTNISGNSQFISSSGEVCGTSTLDFGSTEDEIVVNFTNQDNETYTLTTGASSDITIICPNDETFTLTAEEQQVLEACTDIAGDGGSVCEVDIGPIDGTCVSDADCASLPGLELACCDVGIGTMSCLPRSVCDSL